MVILLLVLALSASAQSFREHTIASGLQGGYQVVPVDMNGDGRPDLIALASGVPELVWFENPTWKKHVIGGPFPRMINVAPYDIDGDGVPELALAYRFENAARNSVGTVAILRFANDRWETKVIDAAPTSHRLRWADLFGSGAKVLINSVLTGPAAEPPDFEGATPLYFYDPRDWKRQSIPGTNRGVVHGILIAEWNADNREDVLTAGFTGISAHGLRNGKWFLQPIAAGAPDAWPNGGSSDIAIGRQRGNRRFLAAIEPWHGSNVAVYNGTRRTVIDTSLADGHTILAADFDGDGQDEIVAGCRGGPKSVYLYRLEGATWKKRPVDEGGMPAAGCAAVDLNGDKRLDLACIGSSSQTLKWYENTPSR